MLLAQLSAGFQSLPPLHTSKLGPSGAVAWVGGFVNILGPCGSLQQTLLWGLEFLLLPQPPQVFSVRGFEALSPRIGTLGCTVCLAPQSFFLMYPHTSVGPPSLPATALPHILSTPPPPLLPVCMNDSSLSPWLSDFHTVWFSGSSGWFLFLNLFLPFFWLCEGGTVYLSMPPSWLEVSQFFLVTFEVLVFFYWSKFHIVWWSTNLMCTFW